MERRKFSREFKLEAVKLVPDLVVSETIDVGVVKRQRRAVEEKRRIVEATMVPGASIARVAREHGVNAT